MGEESLYVGLIPCGKTKRAYPAPAREFYCGRGFRRSRQIVEQFCREWAAERRAWADRVAVQIQKRWPNPDQVFIALLAHSYEKALRGRLVINPLRKKRSVVRFIWLATQAKRIQRSKAKPK